MHLFEALHPHFILIVLGDCWEKLIHHFDAECAHSQAESKNRSSLSMEITSLIRQIHVDLEDGIRAFLDLEVVIEAIADRKLLIPIQREVFDVGKAILIFLSDFVADQRQQRIIDPFARMGNIAVVLI